jgi:quinol monooxygenase YgiN
MTTISAEQDVMTLINVFTVDPGRCDELVQVLVDATAETVRHIDGFVSANIHRSVDGQRVVNYAQWSSLDAFNAMREHPDVQPHMRRAAELADGFDPIVCSVVDTTP